MSNVINRTIVKRGRRTNWVFDQKLHQIYFEVALSYLKSLTTGDSHAKQHHRHDHAGSRIYAGTE